MPRRKPLPRKLSALLRIAVEDAKAVSKDKRYRLNMGTYHTPNPADGRCHVCMAGAVIAQRLGVRPTRSAHPASTPGMPRVQLRAIDDMRDGAFSTAIWRTTGKWPAEIGLSDVAFAASKAVEATFDNDHGRAHWRSYLKAARILEEAGL